MGESIHLSEINKERQDSCIKNYKSSYCHYHLKLLLGMQMSADAELNFQKDKS